MSRINRTQGIKFFSRYQVSEYRATRESRDTFRTGINVILVSKAQTRVKSLFYHVYWLTDHTEC